MMQTFKCIGLQIMHYGKNITMVSCKEPCKNNPLLSNNLPLESYSFENEQTLLIYSENCS